MPVWNQYPFLAGSLRRAIRRLKPRIAYRTSPCWLEHLDLTYASLQEQIEPFKPNGEVYLRLVTIAQHCLQFQRTKYSSSYHRHIPCGVYTALGWYCKVIHPCSRDSPAVQPHQDPRLTPETLQEDCREKCMEFCSQFENSRCWQHPVVVCAPADPWILTVRSGSMFFCSARVVVDFYLQRPSLSP